MFRFTIRELVLLTLVVSVGLGWWLDRRRLAGPLQELAEFQTAKQRELAQQKLKERREQLMLKLYSARAINEYGAPSPGGAKGPPLTKEEQDELFNGLEGQ